MSTVDTLVTSIFSGIVIALLVAMFVAQRRQVDQLRREMATMRTELKADIATLRTELKADIATLRTEFKADIATLRIEFRAEIAEVRTELKAVSAELRRALSAVEKDTAMLVGRLLPEDEVLARITNRPEPAST